MRIYEIVTETKEYWEYTYEELADLEMPLVGANGQQVGVVKFKDAKPIHVSNLINALSRKRSPQAVELKHKAKAWIGFLRDEMRQAEEERAKNWIARLDNVVFTSAHRDYAITLDSMRRPGYAVLWYQGKKVGSLSTRYRDVDGVEYLGIAVADIEKQHQGKGYGTQMYRALLANTQTAGIASYLPDRSNRTTVPAIYKKLGGRIEGDYAIIDKPRN